MRFTYIYYTCLFWVLLFTTSSFSQVVSDTIILSKDSLGQDAMVASSGLSDVNFARASFLNVYRDNNQTTPITQRTFLKFDLTKIPANAIITNAELILTPKSINTNQSFSYILQRVESEWILNNLTWNNQPSSYRTDQININEAEAMSMAKDVIDVKKHVQKMVNYPYNNHGWVIMLNNERLQDLSYGINFYSSNQTDSSLFDFAPKLIVSYVLPVEISTTVKHCTSGNNDGEASISLSGGSGLYSSSVLYKVNINPTDSNKQVLSGISSNNIIGNAINYQGLEAGLYLVKISNPDYSDFTYKHFLIGRVGDTVSVVISHNAYIEQTKIGINLSANPSINDYANTNYGPNTSSLNVATTGTNTYGGTSSAYNFASLLNLNLDVPKDINIINADLYMLNWFYFQTWSSSNEAQYRPITSYWNQNKVTWNNRPEVDTNTKVILPKTSNPNGFSTGMDTINIIPLMQYWQQNPNQGIEISLTNYEYTKGAHRTQRKFNNGSFFKMSFVVPPVLEATYDETKEEGTITINAPEGELPYTYIINSDTIKSLSELWVDYQQFITDFDTSFAIPEVDSTTFFSGKINSKSFEFNELKSGKYFVAIFDNSGKEIFQNSVIVMPETYVAFGVNVQKDSNGYIQRQASANQGKAILEFVFDKDSDFNLSFTLKNIGQSYFGLNYANDTISNDTTDVIFGVYIINSNTYKIISNGRTLNTVYNISENDELTIKKEDNYFKLFQNNKPKYTSQTKEMLNNNLKMNLVFDSAIQYKTKYGTLQPLFSTPNINITYPECGDVNGDLNVSINNGYWYLSNSNLNVVLKNGIIGSNGTIINSTNFTNGVSYTFNNLPIGIYTLQMTWTVNFGWFSFNQTKTTEVAIGYIVDWIPSQNTQVLNVDLGNTITTVSPNVGGNTYSLYNTIVGQDNWVQFQSNMKSINYGFKGQVFSLVNPNSTPFNGSGTNEINLINTNLVFFGLGLYTFVSGNNASTQNFGTSISYNNNFRIHQDQAGFKIYKVNTPNPFYSYYPQTFSQNELSINTFQLHQPYYRKIVSSFCYQNFDVVNYGYYRLTRSIGSGYYQVSNNELLFEVDEEYSIQSGTYLNYRIYNSNMQVIAGVTNNGLNIIGGAPLKTINIGQNGFNIDLTQMVINSGFYLLEVTNLKGEKVFMKFKIN